MTIDKRQRELLSHLTNFEIIDQCPICGSELEIPLTFSTIYCTNPKCIAKIEYRIQKIKEDLMLEDFDTIGFIQKFNITTPYEIYKYNPERDGSIDDIKTLEESKQIYKRINYHRRMLLIEYLRRSNLPYLRNYSEIFLDTTLDEIYKNLETEGIYYIQNKLGVPNEDITMVAVELMRELLNHKDEIYKGLEAVQILEHKEVVGVYFMNTKPKDFLLELNYAQDDKYYYESKIDVAEYIYMTEVSEYSLIDKIKGTIVTDYRTILR